MKRAMLLAVAVSFPLSCVQAAETENPVSDFLKAADNGDISNMQVLLSNDVGVLRGGKLSPSDFFKRLESCYLRRVYAKNDRSGPLLGAWMCSVPGDANQSRVLIVSLTNTDKGLLLFDLVETQNKRPAPPRSGSAFGSSAQP